MFKNERLVFNSPVFKLVPKPIQRQVILQNAFLRIVQVAQYVCITTMVFGVIAIIVAAAKPPVGAPHIPWAFTKIFLESVGIAFAVSLTLMIVLALLTTALAGADDFYHLGTRLGYKDGSDFYTAEPEELLEKGKLSLEGEAKRIQAFVDDLGLEPSVFTAKVINELLASACAILRNRFDSLKAMNIFPAYMGYEQIFHHPHEKSIGS